MGRNQGNDYGMLISHLRELHKIKMVGESEPRSEKRLAEMVKQQMTAILMCSPNPNPNPHLFCHLWQYLASISGQKRQLFAA